MTLDNYQKNLLKEKEKTDKRKRVVFAVVGGAVLLLGMAYAYKKFIK